MRRILVAARGSGGQPSGEAEVGWLLDAAASRLAATSFEVI